jgi:iron complex transport system ATP-binding protein
MSAHLALRELGVPGRLRGVTLALGPGRAIAVVGRNGSGKTTLVRAALGLERAQGDATLDGTPVAAMSPAQRAAHLAWLPQSAGVPEGLTALEVVAAARYRFGEGRAASERAALEALGESARLADRPLHTLSGGEVQRVRMAALRAQQAALWLLDEPGNHLDPAAQLELWAGLGDAVRAGCGLIVVTHDVTLLPALGPVPLQVLGLADGEVAFLLDGDDPTLVGALGALLGLGIEQVSVRGRPQLVIVTSGAP